MKLINKLSHHIAVIRRFKNNTCFINYLRVKGVRIGNNVRFRYPKNTTIDLTRPSLISLGNDIDINDNFTIMTHDFSSFVFRNKFHDFISSSGPVSLGDNIYIGRDVTILKGVHIGNNCIIGLGSVVTKDIPDNSVACGVPCKVICSIDEYYRRRKSKQTREALEYGVSIMNQYKRELQPADCTEEWSTFLTKEDYYNYRELRVHVDMRLNNELLDKWFTNNPSETLPFQGFINYKRQVEIYYKKNRII